MTVELCVYHCNENHNSLAGLQNGQDCCECMSRRCLKGSLYFRDFVVLITRSGCQIVEMSRLMVQRALCPQIAVSIVLAILVRNVAAVIVLAFTGMVSERDDTF
jgi:hypothetical protein